MTNKDSNRLLNKQKPSYPNLVEAIGGLIHSARSRAVQAINTEMVNLYWEIGRHIVEYEQGGSDRARYGEKLLEHLSEDLTKQFGKGFSLRNIRNFRLLYQAFPIRQAVPAESSHDKKSTSQALELKTIDKRQSVVAESDSNINLKALPANLSWTHILLILWVKEPLARQFYIKQCQLEQWSTRELERQINSMLFERIALSKDKKGVLEMAEKGQQVSKPEDLLKDPYVFEFLNLPEDYRLSETDLEQRLIDHFQHFLLELGRGFCFVARQKRITVGTDHFYIDLVFYHRILKCYVLIDLKMEAFKPADAGQMNFYINYMKENQSEPDDNPPIGILLCLDRNELYVKYATAGMDNLILAGRFKLALPSAELLKKEVQKVLEG
ncbi:MAG: hypothetical protein COW04_01050 [Deltaproteobacteria bacterium CG12_big_fil_rev_8_21_14_0_65_43_10]|nr:MAG: hypothetical protein COW04_01050 [Deltaproteobacteria bacterium CG12_big_fil_rev_8_21_14_0_65_43_10]